MPNTISFVPQLLSVVGGTVFVVMTFAFVTLPYTLSAHPGDAPIANVTQTFHAT